MTRPNNNKHLVQEFLEAWNAHDVDRACACIGDTCNGGGHEGARRELTAFLGAFPDLAITLEEILAEDDRVATRITMRATHKGQFGQIVPTGKPVVMKASHIFHCADGRIVQRYGQMDRLELMQQLGMKLVPGA
jgi:predicted ester cyclase